MAGHSKFKNIMHRKGAQDKKRAKLFSRIARELTVAAKSGEDPDMNPALRTAIANAKSYNMPKDRIEKAIELARGAKGDDIEEVRYEGYGPCGVAIVVETLTNNRNRTAASIRSIFSKLGGNLGETGSVTFSFEKIGAIYYDCNTLDMEEAFILAIDSGASNFENKDEEVEITCSIEELYNLREKLLITLGEPLRAEVTWIPNNIINIEDEINAKKMLKLLDSLENDEDVITCYHNCYIPPDILSSIE